MPGLSRFILFFIMLLFCSFSVSGEPSEKETDPPFELNSARISNLYLSGKVWGYLKYHHPVVTSGCLDWDAELLRKLPELFLAQDRESLLEALEAWVADFDSIDPMVDCVRAAKSPALGRDLSWISDVALLGPRLSTQLSAIYAPGEMSAEQHYVGLVSGVGNPVFRNEPDYKSVDSLDWRYRLLALYRFWNIVEYWSPYRDLIDPDFDEALKLFIPQFYSANDPDNYTRALMALTASVQDGHTNLWSAIRARPPGGEATSPFSVRFVAGKPIVWKKLRLSPDWVDNEGLDTGGLQPGDILHAIDGESIKRLVNQWSPYYGVSNRASLLREIAPYLLQGAAGPFRATVERNGELLDIESRRIPLRSINREGGFVHDRDGDTFQDLGDGIAYVKLSTIETTDARKIVNNIQHFDALILDLRGYPKSFVVFSIGQHLVRDRTPFARFTNADLSNPGTFHWTEPFSLEPKEPTFDGKIVILVDEATQSQAEYTAMAFRSAPGAIVIGSQTAGADGNVSRIPLPGGHHTAISGIGVFYPDKTPTQKVGIIPDIEVLPTSEGIRDGRDEVLEAAIRYVHEHIKPRQGSPSDHS